MFRLTADGKIPYTYSVLDGLAKLRSIEAGTVWTENQRMIQNSETGQSAGKMLVIHKEAVQ